MWILRSSLPKRHRVVVGFGYDDTRLEEKRPPTREELDTVSATLPVIVVSHAGDAGAYNTIALQRAGISWRTKDPPGGAIRRRGRIQEPNGVLEGSAHAAAFARLVPRLDEKERARLYGESVRMNSPEERPAPAATARRRRRPDPGPHAGARAGPRLRPPPTPAPVSARSARRGIGHGRRARRGRARGDGAPRGRPPRGHVGPLRRSLGRGPGAACRLKVVEEVRKGRTVWRRDPTRR